MDNMENNWNAGAQGDNAASGNSGAAQSAGGQQIDNGRNSDFQNTGYQGGSYQNADSQNGGYQSGGYQNNGYQNAPYQNAPYQNQTYQNASYQSGSPYQGAPLRPDGYTEGPEEPISIGEWLITMLVLAIPCVNLIMLFVWGFGSSEKRSKANYCKAALIWSAIMAALVVVFYIVALAGILSAL